MPPAASTSKRCHNLQETVSHTPIHTLSRHPPRRSHTLRYVLRNHATEHVYLVVNFNIHRREDVGPDGKLMDRAHDPAPHADAAAHGDGDEEHDEEAVLEEARRHLGPTHEERAVVETSPDDVD